MLSWDDFRYVKAIADTRSLAGAATELSVNHSTVFRRLAQVEGQLGSRLFERSRAGYALTPCGEEMVRLAERMGEDIVTFERQVTGHDLRPSGELRVTTNDTVLVHLMTGVFAAFRKAYPEIVLDVVVSNQALNLSKRDADVAIRATDSPPENLVGRRAATIAWSIYGRRDDFPEGAASDDKQLFERNWVALGDNLGGLKVAQYARDHVATERIVYRVNTVLGLAEAVGNGIGIGHLPNFIADADPGLVRLGPPVPEFSAGLWLLTHPDLRQSARVRVFLDFVAAEISRQRRAIEGTA